MKKIILSAIASVGILLGSVNAYAMANTAAPASNGAKVGIIDMQLIMQKSTQISAINEQLTKDFKPRQDKLMATQKSLQDEVNKLNKDAAVMSAADKAKAQEKFNKDKVDLQNSMLSFQRDVAAAQNKAMEGFMRQLNNAVSNVAKTNNFDLILQRAGVPFFKETMDVTQQVTTELNKK